MTDQDPEVIDLACYRGRHGQPGYFALADLPQRGSIEEQAFGTGWWELDQIFKFYLGQFVVVTGIAGHGKSTFLLNVICNLARERGLKSFLYVPENEAYLLAKIKKLWGTKPGFDHLAQSQIFVQSATPQSMNDPPKNLDWVLEQAVVAIKEDHVELVMIDPWNELERSKPKEMLMTDHIGECLMLIKQFCRMFNVIVIMVAHPTKSVFEHGGRAVSLADIEGCYSDDTEVLTRRGWMHHGQLTMSDDVACFDPKTSAVQYHQPERIIRKEYSGPMHRFRGYGFDLLVTPNHRMLVKPGWDAPIGNQSRRGRPVRFEKGKWNFVEAKHVPSANFKIPLAGTPIGGAEPSTVTIADKTYPAEAFWKLVGWYVAEGHFGKTGLTWSQAEGPLAEAFTETFAEAGIPATIGWQQPYGKGTKVTGRWYVGNRFCSELVSWFGDQCGRGAANKRIPDAVFELSPHLKLAFLRAYIEGDGTVVGSGFGASTISPRLRDDLQRLAVELGIATTSAEFPAVVEGHSRKFVILFGGKHRSEVTMRTQRNMSLMEYFGLVWCLTVPTGAYFVRRNGRVSVCGNSMNWFNKCDNGLIVSRDEKDRAKVASRKVRELGAGKVGDCYFDVDSRTGLFTPIYGAAL
jgi:LAGLIDADG-like domain/AAA domain